MRVLRPAGPARRPAAAPGPSARPAAAAHPARQLAAVLLTGMLFALSPASANHFPVSHLHFDLGLSKTTITEGESVTVSYTTRDFRCEAGTCTEVDDEARVWPGARSAHDSAYLRIEKNAATPNPTGAGAVNFGANRDFSWTSYLNSRLDNDRGNGVFDGTAAGTVTISTVDDSVLSGTRTVTVRGSVPYGANLYFRSYPLAPRVTPVTLTILDNEVRPTLALSSSSISENGGSATVTASLREVAAADVTITVAAAAVSPAVTADYRLSSNKTLTIRRGQKTSTGAVTITAVNNSVDAPNKTVTVSATASGGNAVNPNSVPLTIADDDAAPGLKLSVASSSINESGMGNSTTVSATLTGGTTSSRATTVTVAAVAEAYSVEEDASITIAAGQTTDTETVTITAVNNSVDAPNRTVTVSARRTNLQGLGPGTDASLTIVDDDAAPGVQLSVASSSINESGVGNSTTVSAKLTGGTTSSEATEVTIAAVRGAYTVETDAIITIAAGSVTDTETVTITAVNDTRDEPGRETVTGTARNDHQIGVLTGASLTITDDDDPPGVKLSASPESITENGGTTQVSAALTGTTSSAATTVTVAARSGVFTVESDAEIVIAADAMTNAETVTVTAVDNDVDAADLSTTVTGTLANTHDGRTAAAATAADLTITDDDAAPTVTLALTPVAIDESDQDAGTPDTSVSAVSASLNRASAAEIRVAVSAAAGRNAASGDYTLSDNTTLRITAGSTSSRGTVTVSAVDNSKDEADKQVTVSGTVSGGVSGSSSANPSSQTLTIRDDDDPPTVSISSPSVAEGNSGSAHLDFMVTLSAASGRQVTVKYAPATNAGTATAGTDYTAVSQTTLTFAAGETSKRVRVSVTGDTTDEPDETVRLTLSGPTNATLGSASTGVGTITDDDDPPTVSIGSPSVAEGNSGEADLDFTVSLSAASGKQVTVKYAVDGTDAGTATSGTDYTAVTETTLTFAIGDTSKTVTVKVKGDTLNEPNETVRLTLSEPGNATLGSASTGVGTITDDDGAPTVSISSPSVAEGDSGQAHLDFMVSLSAASGRQVTVKYAPATNAGTATAGTDYTAVSQTTLTFTVGQTSKRVRVLVTGDATDEPDETVRLTLSGPANATLGSASTGVGTITDDDDPPTVSIGSPSVAEGNSGEADLDFTVSLSAASGKRVTVKYAVDGTDAGTATSGTDYTAVTETTLTFAIGDTSKTVTVKVKGDTLNEPNETVRLTLSEPANATLGSASTGVGTITDDDGAPTVSISSPSVAEGDSGQAHLDFMVTLSAASGRQVTVKYAPATNAGTATAGTDYTAVSQTTLTFTAGQTSKRVRVLVTGDATDEPDETVRLTLSGPANATLGSASTGVGTITDDDDPPTVSIGSPSVTEGDSGEADLDFTVSLSAASGKRVTVKYADAGTGTATSGTDYTAVTETTLTFAVGDTSKTVTVKVKGDTLNEPNETVRLTLSEPSNATLGSASTGVGTITDDDGAPTVSISSPSVAEGDTGSAHLDFMVTLSTASGRQVTVKYAPATNAGTATAGTDYTAVSQTTLTFTAGQTSKRVRVLVTGDATDELDETVRLTLSGPTNATLGSASTGVGTITDDDDPPTVSIGSASVAEGDSGEADLVFTVSLSAASGKRVTVKYADAGTGTATSGTDYTAVTETTLTFAVGDTSKTVTVKVKGDTLNEPNETVRLTLSEPSNATLGSASTGVGTITDDDGAPTVSISSPSVAEGDTGSAHLDFMVTLSAASGRQVTVKYAPATNAGTATAGADYTAVSQTTLTFTAGQTSKRVRVLVTGDATDEPDETVRLTLSGPANATLGSASTGVGTITDDDDPPTVSIGSPSVTEGDSGEADLDFTVSLSAASGKRVTVKYADAGTGTATAGTDYTAVSQTTLTFTAGQTSKTVTVKVKGDTLNEPNETVRLTLSEPANATLGSASTGVGTITDDDGAPTVSISSPSVAEGDTGSAHLDFMVTLSAASGRQVTVKYAPATNAGTATAGADYTAVSQTTLTFTAGQTSKRVRVLVTGDATDEPDETVRLTLSGPANATLGSASTGVGTITDDDDPPTVSIGSPSVAEGNSGEADLDFTVSLSAASGKRVTVKYAVDGTDAGTATSGTDYAAVTETTLTFAVGDTSKTATVKVKGDTLNEPNETVRLTLSEPANVTLGSAATGVGTITDDDGAPTVSISSPSVAEGDTGSAHLDFMVTLSAASGRQVTVKYAPATNAGTATAGTDYTAVSQTTLTFTVGETSKRVRVLVTGDATDEPDETVRLTLSGPANATLGSASTGTGTITDDDAAPTVSIGSASVAEGDSGEADLDFTVSLSAASGKRVTVKYADAGTGTATAGTDYEAVTETTLTFAVGDTSKTVTVKVKGDTLNEPNETVRLTLSEPSNATLGSASTGVGTITDDDGAPTVGISSPSVAEGDSGEADLDFTVSLSAASGRQVTVKYAPDTTDAGTATAGTDYTAVTETTLTFTAGETSKTVTVKVKGDATDEPDETVRLTLSGPSNATLGSASTGVGTITDDDAAPTVGIDDPSVVEGHSGQAHLDFMVTLSAASGRQVTVKYAVDSTDAGTATAGTDYTAVTETTLTFAVGDTSRTVRMLVTGDTMEEPDETVRLTLSGPVNATLDAAKTTGEGTIRNDDFVPQASPMDRPPSVHAGSDIVADEGAAVVLDGSACSDPENGALTHRWTQVGAWLASAAPADLSREADRPASRIPARFRVALSGADTAAPRFTPRPQPELLENLVLTFRLTVTDPGGQSNPVVSPDPGLDSARDPGLVAITVRPGPDDPPTAVARAAEADGGRAADGGRGADAGGSPSKALTVDEGARVLLSGADSRDPEGMALSYAWTQTGPRGAGGVLLEAAAVTLSDAAAESPTFVAPTQLAADLALEFTLAVNERGDRDAPATDAVTVTVRAGPNDAPTAVARAVGADGELAETLEVDEGAAVTLDGGGSSDPEGEALRYAWTQKSGPAAADLAGTDTARPTFTAPRSARDAAVVFGLVVTDARGLRSAEDTVSVRVRARTSARLERVTRVLLPAAARAMADSRAAAVRRRLERAGSDGATGLPTLTELLERHGPSAQEEGLEWKKSLLPQASFTLPLDGDGGGGIAAWGGGDYRDLDGETGGVKWDGEVASAHLGADRLLSNGARAGLAVSWSEAEFDYADAGDGMDGDWKLRLTGVQPYLGWNAGDGLDLWVSLGYSRGDLEIRDQALAGEVERADADMRMAAAGARGPLYAAGGLEVSLRGEALYAKFEVDGNGAGIAAHDSDVSRLRLAVAARRERELASGARLSPWFELGARHDGGDGATGAGAEVGAGVDYASGRLELSLGARGLAAHSDYDEWGADLSLAYAPGADGRGLAFRLAPSWGATDSGAEELWASGAPGLNEAATEPEVGGRLEAELGYGLKSPLGRGLLTLTAGGEWGEGADTVCRLSGIAALSASASLGLELELRRPKSGAIGRSLMLKAELRF